jgi:D-alanyl-D-alanine carboxypeptidase (penicillin-binding protein 5/6)
MMTAFLAFQALKDGDLSLDDEIPISEKAWRKGGSKMFIEVGKRVTVADILRGIIVQSGNDAAIALAEGMAGSEAAFGDRMTETALQLGMTQSTFRNATGWPDPRHRTTVRDLAILAKETIRQFPKLYEIYAETSFTYNDIRQSNRNPLLYKRMNADGLKTGHTRAAGYGLTASVKRGDRRLILVVNGLTSVKQRSEESERLLEWGFRQFDNYTVFQKGAVVDEAPVWLGSTKTVPLALTEDLTLTMSRQDWKKVKVVARYEAPISAPIAAGQVVGNLTISAPGFAPIERPLIAAMEIDRLGFMNRIAAAIGYLVWGS